MSTTNLLALARSRVKTNYNFPYKFTFSSSSSKMTINAEKFPKYIDTRIYKSLDLNGIFDNYVKEEVQKSFSVYSNPSIFDDDKPRFTFCCLYNQAEDTVREILYVFVKTGPGIRIMQSSLTSSKTHFDHNWIFVCHFDSSFQILDFANHGASEEDLINLLGSGFSQIINSKSIPEFTKSFYSDNEL